MARFDRGWCSIPRAWSSPDPSVNPFHKFPRDRDILITLIHWAVRQDTDVCKRGQVLFSERALASALEMGRRRVQSGARRLMLSGFVGPSQGPSQGPRATILTILNYDRYTAKVGRHDPSKDPCAGPNWGQGGAKVGPLIDKGQGRMDTHTDKALCESIRSLWNHETAGRLPEATELPLKAIEEFAHKRSIEDWKRIFQKATKTPFLIGGGANGWRASLAWILEHSGRVLDGEFDRPSHAATSRLKVLT